MVFFGKLLLHLFRTRVVFRSLRFSIATITVAITIPGARSVPPISIIVTIAVTMVVMMMIMVTTVATSFSFPISVSVSTFTTPLPLPFPLLTLLPALLTFFFSALIFLSSSGLSGCSLLFSPLHILLLLYLTLKLALLLFDGSELCADTFSLSTASSRLSGVLLVRLGAADSLFLGRFVANLCTAQFTHMSFNRAEVKELVDDGPCFLVNVTSVYSTIDKGGGLSSIKSQKLTRVTLNLLFGNF